MQIPLDNNSSPQNTNSPHVNKDSIPDQETLQQVPLYKKKPFMLSSLVLMVVLASTGAYILLQSSRSVDTRTVENEPTEQASEVELVNQPQTDPLPGFRAEAPSNWTYFFSQTNDLSTHILLSPDAEPTENAYSNTSNGTSIAIFNQRRDSDQEAEYDRPLDAYISYVGAPRILSDEVPFFEQEIDKSRFISFTNKNGIDFISYVWGYEGCYLSAIFLSSEHAHTLYIKNDGTCPDTDFIESSEITKSFIDSIELIEGEDYLSADITITNRIDNPSEPTYIEVYTPAVSFYFEQDYTPSIFSPFSRNDSGMTAEVDSNGNFITLKTSASGETIQGSYGGSSPSSWSGVYDTSITYTRDDTIDVSAYEELGAQLYGLSSEVEAVQNDGSARRYTYYKLTSEGAFRVDYTAELYSSHQLEHHLVNNGFVIEGLETLRLL